MQKLDAASPQAMSTDFTADNVARLKALFPELVTEGPDGASVDVDVLKALVGDRTVGDADERYGFHWHGKRSARYRAHAVDRHAAALPRRQRRGTTRAIS